MHRPYHQLELPKTSHPVACLKKSGMDSNGFFQACLPSLPTVLAFFLRQDADGESEAGTSMASAEIGTNLEGDFAVARWNFPNGGRFGG